MSFDGRIGIGNEEINLIELLQSKPDEGLLQHVPDFMKSLARIVQSAAATVFNLLAAMAFTTFHMVMHPLDFLARSSQQLPSESWAEKVLKWIPSVALQVKDDLMMHYASFKMYAAANNVRHYVEQIAKPHTGVSVSEAVQSVASHTEELEEFMLHAGEVALRINHVVSQFLELKLNEREIRTMVSQQLPGILEMVAAQNELTEELQSGAEQLFAQIKKSFGEKAVKGAIYQKWAELLKMPEIQTELRKIEGILKEMGTRPRIQEMMRSPHIQMMIQRMSREFSEMEM